MLFSGHEIIVIIELQYFVLMKKSILIALSSIFCVVLLAGYSNGPAYVAGINATGSFGSTAGCDGSNCHGPKDLNMVVDITIKDVFGNEVNNSRYTPNAYYRVYVSGYASGNFPIYSYQFSANSATGFNGNGGYFVPAGGLHATTVGQAVVVEPDQPRTTTLAGSSNNYRDSFFWQAPPAGSGEWTIYAAALLGNDNGSRLGDKWMTYSRNFFPNPTSTTDLDNRISTRVFPNPCKNQFSLDLSNAETGTYELAAYDLRGQQIYTGAIAVKTSTHQQTISTDSWAAGLHFLEVRKDGKKRVITIAKQ